MSGYTNIEAPITDLPLIVFGDHSCSFKYLDVPFVRGADGTQLMKFNHDVVLTKYMYFYLQNIEIHNAGKYERHYKYLKETEVYLPTMAEQQRIIAQVEQYEAVVAKALAVMAACPARRKQILDRYLQA